MKIQKFTFALLAIIAMVAGCTKDKETITAVNDNDGKERPLSIKLDYTSLVETTDDSPTKTIFSDLETGKGLKVAWDAEETISVLSYSSEGAF